MTWPKPDIPIILKTNKPKIVNWALGFLLYIFLAFTLVWFNLNNEKLGLEFFVYMFIFILLFFLMLAVRVYYYLIIAHEGQKYWTNEVEKVHGRWQEWANESIGVVDSYFLTPQKITAKSIFTASVDIYKDEVLTFSDDEYSLHDLLQHLNKILSQLPDVKLTTTLIANQSTLDNVLLVNDIELMLEEQLARYMKTPLCIKDCVDNQLVNTLIDNQDEMDTLQLLLVYNLDDPNSSDFIGYFLFSPRRVAIDYQIKLRGSVLRLMITDELDKAVTQMLEMQPTVMLIRNIWLSQDHHIINHGLVLLLQKLSTQNADNVVLPEQHKLSLYQGLSSSLSYWLALHFACDWVEKEQTVELVMGQLENNTLFNIVVSQNRES